jgi:hypothetical protein
VGIPKRGREDNIKTDIRGVGWGGMDWINLAHDRDQWWVLVNTEMNLRDSYNVWKFLSNLATGAL